MTALTDPNLGLFYGWSFGETPWNTGMDYNLRKISCLIQGSVLSRTTSNPPPTPVNGDRYIIPDDTTDEDWVTQIDSVARRIEGGWEYYTPEIGWEFWVEDEEIGTRFLTSGWVDIAAGTGDGTVTSVGLSMPAEFSVAGSPVTTSGTLAVTKANQSANQIYAGPSSGGASAPVFRALVQADLPAQPYDIPVYYPGAPGNSAVMARVHIPRAVTFPVGLSGSYGSVVTNPTAAATLTIKVAGSSVGTVDISTGGVVTFTFSSPVVTTAGDLFELINQASADATLADISVTFAGAR